MIVRLVADIRWDTATLSEAIEDLQEHLLALISPDGGYSLIDFDNGGFIRLDVQDKVIDLRGDSYHDLH